MLSIVLLSRKFVDVLSRLLETTPTQSPGSISVSSPRRLATSTSARNRETTALC